MSLGLQILQIPCKCPKMEEPPSSASRYPVALLPNQYSDYFRRYSADELRSLPVMTVLKLPHKVITRQDKIYFCVQVVIGHCLQEYAGNSSYMVCIFRNILVVLHYYHCAVPVPVQTKLKLQKCIWSSRNVFQKGIFFSFSEKLTMKLPIQKMFAIRAWFCVTSTTVACRQWRNHGLEQELEWCQRCDRDGWALRPA